VKLSAVPTNEVRLFQTVEAQHENRSRMYIYILLDTVLTTDVNKYSLASARCQPIWRTFAGERDLFLAVAKDCGIVVYVNQSQQSISPCFG